MKITSNVIDRNYSLYLSFYKVLICFDNVFIDDTFDFIVIRSQI